VAKTTVIDVKLFHDFVCQKLSKSANVLQSYSKNKSGTVFLRHSVDGEILENRLKMESSKMTNMINNHKSTTNSNQQSRKTQQFRIWLCCMQATY